MDVSCRLLHRNRKRHLPVPSERTSPWNSSRAAEAVLQADRVRKRPRLVEFLAQPLPSAPNRMHGRAAESVIGVYLPVRRSVSSGQPGVNWPAGATTLDRRWTCVLGNALDAH